MRGKDRTSKTAKFRTLRIKLRLTGRVREHKGRVVGIGGYSGSVNCLTDIGSEISN